MFYSFDEFELSEQEFLLVRQGQRVPLEPRALRVLLLLVEHRGKLLSKSAILEAVWQNTFVEETTLTRIIAVLRKQLEDDPRAPKYIETVPTRGYRFIAPVEVVLQPRAAQAAELAIPVPTPSVEQSIPTPAEEHVPGPASPHAASQIAQPTWLAARPALRIGAAVLCLALLAVTGWRWHQQRERVAQGAKELLVLADFTNAAGDPVFDDALRQGMLVQLEQSPTLRLAGDSQIRRTLRLMGRSEDAPITPEVGRELCERIGGTVVLDGSIARMGSEYVLGLRARRCDTGEHLHAEQVQVSRKEDVLRALSQIATGFRTRFGEAGTTVHELDRPLEEATTPSLDALKAFSEGMRMFNSRGSQAALPLFQRATEIDPRFAMAHVLLGRMAADLGDERAAAGSTATAYKLRDRTSERERFSVDVSYDLLVSGNLEHARSTCDAWLQMYPRDVYARAFLAGAIYPAYGQYERALQEAKTAMELDPGFVLGYRSAALALISLNRLNEAEAMLRLAGQRGLYLPSFHTAAYRLAFLRNDAAGMQHALEAAPANPWLLSYQAATLARAGHMAEARQLEQQALHLAEHGSRKELEARLLTVAALTEALYGYRPDAERMARQAGELSPAKDVVYSSALTLALVGQTEEAGRMADDLARRLPEDTLVQRVYRPTVQAAIALGRGRPEAAVQLLEATEPFAAAQPLHPHCLRGRALLALHRPAQAVDEFRAIVGAPGLVLNDPLANAAEIDLARSLHAAGKPQEAKVALDDVLTRWKGADAGLPLQQAALQERAALQFQ